MVDNKVGNIKEKGGTCNILWLIVAAVFILAIVTAGKGYFSKDNDAILDKIKENEKTVTNVPDKFIGEKSTQDIGKIKGNETICNSIKEAEEKANTTIYEPRMLPSGVKLSKVHLQYTGNTVSSIILKYSSYKEEVAFKVTQRPITNKDDMLNDLENRKGPEGKPIYEKCSFNNGTLYVSSIGEKSDKYRGEGIINNTVITIAHFGLNLLKDDIISMFSSMK